MKIDPRWERPIFPPQNSYRQAPLRSA
jgi:hypothetical protein